MNKVGIIVADENELKSIKIDLKKPKKINQFIFYEFKIKNTNCIFVWSGIGIANAAACTQALIDNFNIDKIVNFGSCGGYGEKINVYDVYAPEKIYYHDVITPWYNRGQTPGEKEFYSNNIKGSKNINLASGSSFITNKIEIAKIANELNVNIFDMEAAAICQIANKNNKEVFVIKSISDVIGKNDEHVDAINKRIEKAGIIAWEFVLDNIIYS